MATRKSKEEAPAEATTSSDMAAELAKEFQEAGGKRVNPDIHFHKFEKKNGELNPLAGVVLERRKRKSEEGKPNQFYYIIGLTRPTTLFNSDGEEVLGEKGMFAWVDERWCLQSLQSHLPIQREVDGMQQYISLSEVAIIPKGKRKLDGSRTLWVAEVYAKPIKPDETIPLIAPKANQPPPQLTKAEQGEIPF